ncbi:HlyD family secretion protein [Thiohalomonas denitrificans]|uniref:HlyD family secretion protein n=1 Tax=Thiohalomonas denitrificans TaxID=415747 RepID=A0A1G5QCM0_9GAMM|nr:efflux RND transporter periplasmic adaptor subunit [Thiohalomonas denitrificans]SCZ59336.1 HlyD family secretion protein [Thiohalomonas denitrificans]
MSRKISISIVLIVLLALLGFGAWTVLFKPSGLPPEGFARGNGRIEADLIDVSPRLAGRVAEIKVREGARVQPGDALAVMDTAELESRLMQAEAAVASAEAAVGMAAAQVAEAEAKLALARSEQARAETLSARDLLSPQDLDIRRTETQVAKAALAAARANLRAKQRGVDAEAAGRTEIAARIADSTLYAQGAGRVLYRLAQPGEIMGNGGKLLTLVSLEDVYMEFFLSATEAPRVRIGDEARIVPDIMPDTAVPAVVSFVSPQAQFTPKQVETVTERESLMFRVRVSIPAELIATRMEQVKTGVRGVAWVRLARDDGSLPNWPEGLTPPLLAEPDKPLTDQP